MATPLQFSPTFKPQSLDSTAAAIMYNGFKFPPAVRCLAQVTPIYDDANRMVKYNELSLKVSFYLFHGLNLGATGTAASPAYSTNLYSGSYVYANNIPTGTDESSSGNDGVEDDDFTTDQEMEYLKSRLMESGQNLRVTAQGLGTINIQDPNVATSVDVDNGPKPSIVTWRPLGNKCCFIEWSVTSRYSPCAATYPTQVAQFPFTVTFDINRRGLTVRTITGSVEMATGRVSTDTNDDTAADAHAGATYWGYDNTGGFAFSTARQLITDTFPMLTGFYRDQKYTLSADRKTVNFTITDDEIDSDEAFGEGCAFEDVRLSTNNTDPLVFNKWSVTLSGSIELIAGYPKSYALAEVSRLFTRHFKICGALSSGLKHDNAAKQERSEGETHTGTGAAESSVVESSDLNHYLESVSFTDHIFSRKIDFSISWSLITSIQTLLAATGMFIPARYYPVDGEGVPVAGGPVSDPAQAQRDQWLLWKTSLGIFLDNGGFQALEFNQDDDVVVSLCKAQIGERTVPELNIQYDPDIHEQETSPVTAKNSWSDVDVRFEIERRENNSHHTPLGSHTSASETARIPDSALVGDTSAYNVTTFAPNKPSSPDAEQEGYVHAQREPDYVLHFSGYAVRLNYPVPEFNVESYGGQTVIPIGTSTLKPRFIGNGVDLVTGQSYKIYGLMWHKMYALPGAPLNAKIITDAHKDIYS